MFERYLLLSLLLLPGLALGQPLSDPTRPPADAVAPGGTAATPRPPLQVTSILASEQRRLARVNGAWVSEGEQVAGARVLRISDDSVRFRRDGKILNIRLNDGRVDKQWQHPAAADDQRTTTR